MQRISTKKFVLEHSPTKATHKHNVSRTERKDLRPDFNSSKYKSEALKGHELKILQQANLEQIRSRKGSTGHNEDLTF